MKYAITDTEFIGEIPLERRLEAYDTCELLYPKMKSHWDGLRRNAILERMEGLEEQRDLFGRSFSGWVDICLEIGALRAKLARLAE